MLKKSSTESKDFLEVLERYNGKYLLHFSHAHMLDLKNDRSDKKYEDLRFMDQMTHRYLFHNFQERRTDNVFQKPTEVFENDEQFGDLDIDEIFDFSEFENDKNLKPFIPIFNYFLKEMKFQMPSINVNELPEETRDTMAELFDGKELSLHEMTKKFVKYSGHFLENKIEYRAMRAQLQAVINTLEFDRNNPFQINEALKNSILRKTFKQYVSESISYRKKDGIISFYDFHSNAYLNLDLMGFSAEKIKGNNKPNNVLNDGIHSYYAGHCDLLITSDAGLMNKSNLLYQLLDVSSRAISPNDFINNVETFFNYEVNSSQDFHNLLSQDVRNGDRISTFSSLTRNRVTEVFRTGRKFFNWFDQLEVLREPEGITLVLVPEKKGYSKYILFEEIESIVNKCLELFGPDSYGYGKYSIGENEDINEGKWKGRIWHFANNQTYSLEVNEGSKEFCLILGTYKYISEK